LQVGVPLLGAPLEEAVPQIVLGFGDEAHVLALGRNLLIQVHSLFEIVESIVAVGLVEPRLHRLRLLHESFVVLVDRLGVLAVAV